ncbi:putative thioredoxin, partial [Toxoplasma gondii GAB2-2007-GAL-DOM2]
DMKRFDDLSENLEHLEREAANAEADAMALGVMMGEELLRDDVEHLAEALLAAESLVGQSSSVEGGAGRH